MQTCILLNADYTFLNMISWKKAVALVVKKKAEVLKYTEKVIRNFEKTVVMKIPAVMRLMKIIRSLYRTSVPFSKKNVMVRDGFVCAYCNSTDELTIDHVLPISRGGKSEFDNCVTACKACNAAKANKTCGEAGIYLKKRPYAPTIAEFIRMRVAKLGINDLLKELGIY